jgi:hypothetical protein
MGQDQTPGVATIMRCPWCSAEISTPGIATCPTCGAALVEPTAPGPNGHLLDAEAIYRAARIATPVKRSRLVSWITGDYDTEDEVPAPPGSLAPPPPEVRLEMARLAFQAEYANLEAEAGSIVSEAEAEARASAAAGRPSVEATPAPHDQVPTARPAGDDNGAPLQRD